MHHRLPKGRRYFCQSKRRPASASTSTAVANLRAKAEKIERTSRPLLLRAVFSLSLVGPPVSLLAFFRYSDCSEEEPLASPVCSMDSGGGNNGKFVAASPPRVVAGAAAAATAPDNEPQA